MDIEHDVDGVSIDLSIAEAMDLAAFLETQRNRHGVEELYAKLRPIFGANKRYSERVNHLRLANSGRLRYASPSVIWKNGRNIKNEHPAGP